MPPAFVAVGAWDALRDDSALLADCWPSSVEYVEVEESPHGFQRFPTDVAHRVKALANQWLQAR
ncbi:unnamed protein product [Phaeothamnion confervicola]